MFELLLVGGLGAIVVCMLKGRVWRGAVGLGLGALAVVVGYVLSGRLDSAIPAILANTGFAVGAVLLAMPAAEPASPWARAGAVDAQGRRRIDAEPTPRRLWRALLGGVIGLLPAILFILVVVVIVEAFDLPGDAAQVAFLGPPFGLLGALAGAVIGFNWVPKTSKRTEAPVEESEGNSVLIGSIAGVGAGALAAVIASSLGVTTMAALNLLLLVGGGVVGGILGRRMGKGRKPPQAPVGGTGHLGR